MARSSALALREVLRRFFSFKGRFNFFSFVAGSFVVGSICGFSPSWPVHLWSVQFFSPSGPGGMGGVGSVARWPQANGRSATEAPHRKQSLAQRVSHTREASVQLTGRGFNSIGSKWLCNDAICEFDSIGGPFRVSVRANHDAEIVDNGFTTVA
jgi:hypothetical protein